MKRPKNLSVGDRFVITGCRSSIEHSYGVGELVTLIQDDGSKAPYFISDADQIIRDTMDDEYIGQWVAFKDLARIYEETLV